MLNHIPSDISNMNITMTAAHDNTKPPQSLKIYFFGALNCKNCRSGAYVNVVLITVVLYQYDSECLSDVSLNMVYLETDQSCHRVTATYSNLSYLSQHCSLSAVVE